MLLAHMATGGASKKIIEDNQKILNLDNIIKKSFYDFKSDSFE